MRRLKLILNILGCLALSVPAFSTTYYVSNTGSDTNTGTSINAPLKTIRRGLTRLYAGDTLIVRGGTYQELLGGSTPVTVRRGIPTAPITFKNYGNERVVIKGLLWLSRPSYWTISGINVTWLDGQSSKYHMVRLVNGVNWTFTNAEVWGAKSYAGILVASTILNEPSNWQITECRIHDTYKSNDTNQDHAIYCNSGLTAGNGVIERNIIYNISNGNGVKLGGADSTGGTQNVEVRYNTIYNAAQGVLVSWKSRHNQVYRNIIVKMGSGYGCVRGYQLDNTTNVAFDNWGYLSKALVFNYDGGMGVTSMGDKNVFGVDPLFYDILGFDFHTKQPDATGYGKYGYFNTP